MGLWGAISGYIALNDDKSTVFGAYFNHESETAGLGAEIKDNRAWQEKFQGKHLFSGDVIALSVNKKITDNATQVDAVTGATLTSNGVTNMLHDCLTKYIKFLKH
jgi:Na+-transporting NADH:ubiquinone oxidoreductase subunit C